MVERQFRVVTHKRWLAELFRPMGAVIDHGFDIDPATALDTIWWAPGAWVASAHLSGVQLPLLSCGPDWLANVPREYRGRDVRNMTISEIPSGKAAPTFAKLPEVKHDGIPAQVYGECYLRDTLEQYRLPAETIWQLQEPVRFTLEARFWVAHGAIVADSLYRIGNLIWGYNGFDRLAQRLDTSHTLGAMRYMAKEVAHVVDAAPGYTLDIGLANGQPLVIEANAAWSSGPYNGDPAGIFEAIKASHDFGGEYPQWAWTHSPVFNKARPLHLTAA